MIWTVTKYTDATGPYTRYEPGPASPCRQAADEINGLSKRNAVKVLREMYDEVKAFSSGVFICRNKEMNGDGS